MNERSKRMKGLSRRLIAWLLCCVFLVAASPVSATTLEDSTPAAETTVTEQLTEATTAEPVTTSVTEPMTTIQSTTTENVTADTSSSEPGTTAEAGTPEATTANGEIYTTAEGTSEGTTEVTTATEGTTVTESTTVTEGTTVTDTTEDTSDAGLEKDQAQQSFYDEVMAADSCYALYALIADDDNYDEASALTAEQVYAIRGYAQSLEDDGYQEVLVETLNELLKYLGEDVDSEYDIGLSGELNQSMYKNTVPVYWDTITELKQSASSTNGANVEKVTLGNSAVTKGYAGTVSWSGGQKLSTYFPGAYANNMKDATMSITATTGYYVTGIVVACAPTPGGSGTLVPFKCGTWSSGNEFIRNFNLTNSSYSDGKYTLSFDINSVYFSHNGGSTPAAYFILITTAKVPTPLYVEYDYGDVNNFLTVDSHSAFANPTWTVANSENSYGSGEKYTNGVLTNGTQFAYQYPNDDTSVIANWSHKANTISADAAAEAAKHGYYFAGWSATWYNDCSVTTSKDSHNNNCTMAFDSQSVYMIGSYNAGEDVQLPTNVRLVAQWKPITLKMTKTVSGLSGIPEHSTKNITYTLELQKLQADGVTYETVCTKDYTITGDGTLPYTFAEAGADVTQVIASGTYRVVENGNYDIKGTSENAYCTTTYPVGTVEVTADGTVEELQVLNTYSSTPAAYTLTVQKTLSGNMYNKDAKFEFTVTYVDNGKTETKTFELGMNDVSDGISIPVDATVTISETQVEKYKLSVTSATYGEGGHLDYENVDNNVTFKMPSGDVSVVINNEKSVNPETGVILDTLPYILILAVVIIGGVLLIGRRRSRNDA